MRNYVVLLGLIAVGAACVPGAAHAQREVFTTMELDGGTLALAPRELAALSELGNLVRGSQRALQDRALAIARRVAVGRDARYVLAIHELELGGSVGTTACAPTRWTC